MKLTATGENGLNELKDKLEDSDCGFGYARVEYSNVSERRVTLVARVRTDIFFNRTKSRRESSLYSSHGSGRTLRSCVRPKFVYFSCCGLNETAYSDANRLLYQVSVHAADVKRVLSVFSIEVPAREKGDVDEEHIVTRLRKVRSVHSSAQTHGYLRLNHFNSLLGWGCQLRWRIDQWSP